MVDKIDGAIGEGSPFHEQNGYYAQGVGPETAVLPDGWEERLIVVNNENTNGVSGLCLKVHDLAISKLVAARLKDLQFVQELIQQEMIEQMILIERLAETRLSEIEQGSIKTRIESLFSE